jgi:hypothetical protein
MAKDPAAVAQKWSRNLGNATQDIQAGVQAVTQAPGAKAAANVQGWIAGVQRSQQKWATNVGRVSLASWQNDMITKGLPRIASGASAAEPKMASFMTSFLPHVERVAQQVRAMPKGGLQNGIARAVAQIQGNAAYQRPAQG